ncbi:glutamyl-tRNA reductase [Nesterenkonia sp. MY13]|uniref:Glutamyl-tRNA reductase n=1 Tax=Nesterenkonia sedimenti TaxID=1463632 RepID=A0A7X8TIC1_9MICC|nr:glutamyl-tRNA reductase [Nesterenkonia sedimenti]NLS09291.1 glutamyl-tRNA reductase [Nesterenkonia sedimenti]
MVLFSLVATHSDLDLETVGTLSSGAADVAASVSLPAVTLATCNRMEIYAEAPADSPDAVEHSREQLLEAVAESSGLDKETVANSFRVLVDDAAVKHLFEVGAGLDSAVIGEREIAGQVRRSLSEAQTAGTASGSLTKLFESATRAAKEVGAKTALGARGRSIVSVALDIAGDMRGDGAQFYRDARVVLIGTGAYAGTSLAQLGERGVPDISVFSGSGRAEQFLAERGEALAERGSTARALQMDQLAEAFRSADVIIGCSGGNRQITAAEIRSLAGLDERQEPLTVIDLALSHDFAPDVADLPGVDLITLESVKLAAPDETESSLEQARSVVTDSVQQFLSERAERSADDAIVTLRRHVQSLLDEEMEKVRKHHGCTAAAEEVEFGLRRIVRKLLHTPTVRARELAAEGRGQDYVAALETLFDLKVPSAEDTQRTSAPRRRRAEEFSAAELAQMANYLQQVPDGGFCRHHKPGEFSVERFEALNQLRRSA